MRVPVRALVPAVLSLCLSCATAPKGPESIDSWMSRGTSAWTAMKDDGNPAPALDRAFVQTGMSTSSAIVFVILGAPDAQPWTVKSVEAIDKGVVAAADYRVAEHKIGRSTRVEISSLSAGQRYRVTFATPNAFETVESRTAPEHAEPTSLLLASCNEPWNHPTPGGQTVGVAAASASALRTLDLRANGFLPVELSRGDGGVVPFERSSFLLALGDQAYVDAESGLEGTLALFAGPRSNDLRVAVTQPNQWVEVLERIYRMHFLIPTFHRTLSSLPSAMVWDDHEIRDGWGSQRDEGGLLPSTQQPWAEYFAAARKMTWEFEVARNRNAGGEELTAFDESLERELDTTFGWGDRLQVFLLDTRTARGRPEGTVMSDAQLDRLRAWLLPCGAKPSVFVLGVPVPLSVNHDNAISTAGTTLQSELDDDVIDGWWATTIAENTRNRIETAIVEHATRCPNDRVVLVSGDVHESGLVALSRENKTIAYEVISSGIASMVFNGALSRAFLATRTEYLARSSTGILYSGVGRISSGSSFAELFFEFPQNAAPQIRVLFYPTTAIDTFVDSTLVNVGTTLKGTTLRTGTTTTEQLANGATMGTAAAAIELVYGGQAPRSGDYEISEASTRCSTDLGLFSWGTRIDELATDWSKVFESPRPCRDTR
jgi:hypothetical protein